MSLILLQSPVCNTKLSSVVQCSGFVKFLINEEINGTSSSDDVKSVQLQGSSWLAAGSWLAGRAAAGWGLFLPTFKLDGEENKTAPTWLGKKSPPINIDFHRFIRWVF